MLDNVLGATYLAGLAFGYCPNQDTIAKQWSADRHFTPVLSNEQRNEQHARWTRAVERARNWEAS